jgi:hypothetical protein
VPGANLLGSRALTAPRRASRNADSTVRALFSSFFPFTKVDIAGKEREVRMLMIPMTTSVSSSVNPIGSEFSHLFDTWCLLSTNEAEGLE